MYHGGKKNSFHGMDVNIIQTILMNLFESTYSIFLIHVDSWQFLMMSMIAVSFILIYLKDSLVR